MKGRYRVVGQEALVALNTSHDDRSNLEEHRDTLYQRLEQGYERIEQGLATGGDVTTWEEFWVSLLHEYERVCDELQRDLAA